MEVEVFLKFVFQFLEGIDDNYESDNSEFVFNNKSVKNKMKDTGVKKILVLAMAAKTQENYKNVLELWKILKINNNTGSVATDFKLVNQLGTKVHLSYNISIKNIFIILYYTAKIKIAFQKFPILIKMYEQSL